MDYTSGIVCDLTQKETLEELQDNKLTLVCEKLDLHDLQPNGTSHQMMACTSVLITVPDRLLDIGCGWGTLIIHATKNHGCQATGVTLARKQTAFATDRAMENSVLYRARILCMDFREVPNTYGKGAFTKIVSLEMAEHVGIRRYQAFLKQVYDLLDDDGIFVSQVAGFRPCWQYENLIWFFATFFFSLCLCAFIRHPLRGLFMNKYGFPGADASCSLSWVVSQFESAGFKVKNIDILGVHYSATIYRCYKNWVSNKEAVIAKYGDRWYRVWVFFLA
jgi:cyclopropane fatty-acyl-phospholipid synthase-like methyltransferase